MSPSSPKLKISPPTLVRSDVSLTEMQTLALIRMAKDPLSAQRALDAAKKLGAEEQIARRFELDKQQADRQALQDRQEQLLPKTTAQVLLTPFKACFRPVRR